LLDDAPHDYVSLAWLLDRLDKRSFGLVMLLLALVGLLSGAAFSSVPCWLFLPFK
jgi:hypothetical protein